ncbi:MAG: hypothetical protein KF805_03545 [Phycisphaeraceae bacterium]|nr:hypothetical protein [Phycisphaeraceae bacterium]
MSHRDDNSNQNWAGLLIDSPRRPSEERSLREILGSDSVLLVVRESDTAACSIRSIVQSRSSSILTLLGDARSPKLESLLKIAGTLSSLRRIVVLHSVPAEDCAEFSRRGILVLRDCPEIRDALRELVARESGVDGTSRSNELPVATDSNQQANERIDDGAADQADGQVEFLEAAPQSVASDCSNLTPLSCAPRRAGSRIAPFVRRIERLHIHEPPFQVRGVSA